MVLANTKLKIDHDQAHRFFTALGLNPSEKLPLRILQAKPAQAFPDVTTRNLAYLPESQEQNCGLYLAINGNYGKHKKNDIESGRAIFCEHDDLDKADQLLLWQEKGLPEPTLQVETRHSIHTYWILDQPLPKADWEILQKDLISYMGSDKACKDISRLMRIPGAWHIQKDLTPIQCQLISESGCNYSFSELRSRIPKTEKKEQKENKSRHFSDSLDRFLHDVSNCNPSTIFDWPGHDWKQDKSDSTKYRGNCPFHESKSGTSFVINQQDGVYLWHCPACEVGGNAIDYHYQLSGGNGTPRGKDFINTVEALSQKTGIEPPPMEKKKNKPTGKGVSSVSDISNTDNDAIDIKAEVETLISSGVTGTNLKIEINELAVASRYQPREVWAIYNESLEDSERDRAAAKTETFNLLNISKASVKLVDVVDSRLAAPLSKVTQMIGGKDEAVITSLLPVVASLISTQSKLELIRSTGFYAHPIIFTGIVGESGTAKSPLQKLVLKPLWTLQDVIEQDYRARLQEWEEMEVGEGKKKPPKPTPLDLWTSDVTSERIAEIMSNQRDEKQGVLIWKDELSALIKDNDAYRGGKGSDAEKLLSGRDGSPLKVDRCSKRLNVPQSCYSITGGIQPDTLKQQIDFSDPTGHWARFLLCYLPLTKRTFPEDDLTIDINEYLKGIYQNIRSQEAQNYTLSSEAKGFYKNWYNQLGELAYSEPRQGLRNVYSKMTRDTGVLALLLHCLNAAIAGDKPEPEISLSTLKSAIALAKFYIGQVKLIHAEGDAEEGELSPLYIKILTLSERKGWIKAKDLKMSDRSFRKMNANDIRSFFVDLEAMGFGKTDGKGNRLIFIKTVDTVDTGCQSVDNVVNQSKTPNNGRYNHLNNRVDTFTSSSPTTVETNTNKEKNNLVDKTDNYNKASDNYDNQNFETPTNTASESVDTVSTDCQLVSSDVNQETDTASNKVGLEENDDEEEADLWDDPISESDDDFFNNDENLDNFKNGDEVYSYKLRCKAQIVEIRPDDSEPFLLDSGDGNITPHSRFDFD